MSAWRLAALMLLGAAGVWLQGQSGPWPASPPFRGPGGDQVGLPGRAERLAHPGLRAPEDLVGPENEAGQAGDRNGDGGLTEFDLRECAEACFAVARQAKGRISGAADRAAARRRALELYLAVAAEHPDQGPLTAEALFRAAELQRAAGEPAKAQATLARIAAVPASGTFACRALYEAGHIARREGDLERALEHFEAAAVERNGTERRRDQATYWKARSLVEAGRRDAAEVVLRGLVVACEDPLDRLRAYDTLITLLAEDGRLAAGVGFLAEAKRSVHAESLQTTDLGERVRRALEDLRALEVLRAAIQAAREA